MSPATETAISNRYLQLKEIADKRGIHGKMRFVNVGLCGSFEARVNGTPLYTYTEWGKWMQYLQGKEI